jgi:hypothetical protein
MLFTTSRRIFYDLLHRGIAAHPSAVENAVTSRVKLVYANSKNGLVWGV